MAEENGDTVLEHPNRGKASSKVMRLVVVALLLATVVLMVIIAVGGWNTLEGAKPLQLLFILVDVIFAYFVLRWNRGVLPMIAAVATVLLIFAAVSTPAWFERDRTGFTSPPIDESVLGLLTVLLVPVQLALILAAMAAFRQGWNVEVERPRDEQPRRDPEPAAA